MKLVEDGQGYSIVGAGLDKYTLHSVPGGLSLSDQNGNSIVLGRNGITITSSSTIQISAPQVNLNTAVAKFSGVLQADTITANTVTANTVYKPGAGNIW